MVNAGGRGSPERPRQELDLTDLDSKWKAVEVALEEESRALEALTESMNAFGLDVDKAVLGPLGERVQNAIKDARSALDLFNATLAKRARSK